MSIDDASPRAEGPTRRSRRDRPAKPPLSEEAVIDAALEVLKSDGLEAVTMRRVAQALDTGAASLYVYISNRDALLEAMIDRVVASIEVEPVDAKRWREQVHSLMRRMYEALVAHPGIATLTMGGPPTSEAPLAVPENMMGLLLAGRLDPQDAAWCCDILALLVTGAALEEEVRRQESDDGSHDWQGLQDEVREKFAALPPDRYPLLSAYAEQMVAGDGDQRFRFGIDIVLDGAIARAARK